MYTFLCVSPFRRNRFLTPLLTLCSFICITRHSHIMQCTIFMVPICLTDEHPLF